MSKILKIIALVLFLLEAFGVSRGDFIAFGLASWVGSELV